MTQNPTKEQKQTINQQDVKDTKKLGLGVYNDMFSAKTDVAGQDGGVVTALLLKGFSAGLFDAAIVARRTLGYRAEVFVAQTSKEVLAAAGTTYLKVNVSSKLRELIAQGKRRIVVVCTPCEAAAARTIQQTIGKDLDITIIGLFCFEAFNHDKLKAELQARLGVDLDAVDKVQIRGGQFIVKTANGEACCKVKDFDCASEASCRLCRDFTSEAADVSVGSVGSSEGYSTVIVRTSAGQRLVGGLEAQKTEVDASEVARLAKFKRSRAQKNLSKSVSRQKQ